MKKLLTQAAALCVLATASIGSAIAAVPADVSTAMDTSKTDVGTIGAAVLLIVLAVMVFKWMRGALR